jgi:hypothetical protein
MTRAYAVYPTPYGTHADGKPRGPYSPETHERLLDVCDGIRCNLDYRDPEKVRRILNTATVLARQYGAKTLVPVLDGSYDDPNYGFMETFASDISPDLITIGVPFAEAMNEPISAAGRAELYIVDRVLEQCANWLAPSPDDYAFLQRLRRHGRATDHTERMTPERYANTVKAMRHGLDPSLRLAIAADVVRPGAWLHPDWTRWWSAVQERLTARVDYQIAAVHPYRSYHAKDSRLHWPSWAHRIQWLGRLLFGMQPREAEWEQLREMCRTDVTGTECGWLDVGLTPEQQAVELTAELDISARLGIETVCIYHYASLIDATGGLMPQGQAIKEWRAKRDALTRGDE